jgi:hypothetical protein
MALLDSMHTVSEVDYKKLHTKPLVATSIVIDTEQLIHELDPYVFQPWGTTHLHLPRYGLALVNQSGQLIDNDPINGSLMAYNKHNPSTPIIETDCTISTEVMNISSLVPLRVLDSYWCRSNVFKWNKDALFLPHIDTCLPSPWLRLWMGTEGVVVRFYNELSGELESVDYEPGRVYLIDTSIVHDAYSLEDNVFQLFLSVNPDSYSTIESLLTLD